MDYMDYLVERRMGAVRMVVDKSTALRLIEVLPKRYQYAHHFWSWIWMLSIPAAGLLWYFFAWYWCFLSWFFITPLISSSIKTSAAQFVMNHAHEDPDFFNALVRHGHVQFHKTEPH